MMNKSGWLFKRCGVIMTSPVSRQVHAINILHCKIYLRQDKAKVKVRKQISKLASSLTFIKNINWIIQLKSFLWVSHYDIWAITAYFTNIACSNFFCFYCYFISVFYILGAFLIKQLLHSRFFEYEMILAYCSWLKNWITILSSLFSQ